MWTPQAFMSFSLPQQTASCWPDKLWTLAQTPSPSLLRNSVTSNCP